VQNPRKWRQPVLPERPTAGVAFVALTGAALEQIGANAGRRCRGRDPEYLHQLRVACAACARRCGVPGAAAPRAPR
jgi:hypothetical protein